MVTTRGKNVVYLLMAFGLVLAIVAVAVFEPAEEGVRPYVIEQPAAVNRTADERSAADAASTFPRFPRRWQALLEDSDLDSNIDITEWQVISEDDFGHIKFPLQIELKDLRRDGIYYDGIYPKPETNRGLRPYGWNARLRNDLR